jgi:hypothetical protein
LAFFSSAARKIGWGIRLAFAPELASDRDE